ncbi:hypothetical protein [Brevundimonas vesicularis]|uniref:Uncharacterized protein n=1 Tax=Brevundimonas vesicularis TaxID=41276 RepID=A0A1Z3U820_BREVE|nr:hypothetical protein [Brevundimonas vesicularis]ASE39114.2 hypothetical protein CEP68_06150 [Brevundimonas vesicularis]
MSEHEDWVARLAERQALITRANNLPDGLSEDAREAEVNRLCDAASRVEADIFAAAPDDGAALATQVQLAVILWGEQAPLEPTVRDLLERVAAALVLTPVPLFPSPIINHPQGYEI